MVAAALLVLVASPARAQGASFDRLGDLPGGALQSVAQGVSADGAHVVGWGNSPLGGEAFLWSAAAGMQALGMLPGGSGPFVSVATGVSNEGAVVVGTAATPSGDRAFRWTAATGMQTLFSGPYVSTRAEAVTPDGAIVVGSVRYEVPDAPTEEQAFRYDGGLQLLGDLLPNDSTGEVYSIAFDVSADGGTVAGFGDVNVTEAFRWTGAEGMVGLGLLPGGGWSESTDTSADGAVVVGQGQMDGTSVRAFVWTATTGMTALPVLPGSGNSVAYGVSGDGTTVVGESAERAFIWTAADGMRDLKAVLEGDYGLDLTGWTLHSAAAISDDGLTIVGHGRNPQGWIEAFRAQLPGECASPLVLHRWQSPISGSFHNGASWHNGEVPGPGDHALFDHPEGADYDVSFASSPLNGHLAVKGGNHVRFLLGGHAYMLDPVSSVCGPAVEVGGTSGSPRLEVENGQMVALGPATVSGLEGTEVLLGSGALLDAQGGLRIANGLGQMGTLRVAAGGQVAATGLTIGDVAGVGELVIEGGGEAALTGTVRVGEGLLGQGTVRVLGGGAHLALPEGAVAGYEGDGALVVDGGAIVDAGRLALGRLGTAEGSLDVGGESVVEAERLDVGVEGDGTFFVGGGALLALTGALNLPGGGGIGLGSVIGIGSNVRADVARVGRYGPGTLLVMQGGLVEVGSLDAASNAVLTLNGGCVRIAGAACEGALAAGGGGTLAADTVWVSPGAVLDSAAVALGPGGVLGGSGTLPVDITNAGAINPGDSAGVAGTFTIGGAYAQAAGGALEIELGGTAAGAYDHLSVTGAAGLDGTLRFSHINGFTPAPGDAFEVLDAASVSGTFSGVEGPPGSTYSIEYGLTSVRATVLTVANEPPAADAGLVLHPAAPNPAVGSTTLRFELAASAYVRLAVYDVLGREVAVLVDGERRAGAHEAILDVGGFAPGPYMARLILHGQRDVPRRSVDPRSMAARAAAFAVAR